MQIERKYASTANATTKSLLYPARPNKTGTTSLINTGQSGDRPSALTIKTVFSSSIDYGATLSRQLLRRFGQGILYSSCLTSAFKHLLTPVAAQSGVETLGDPYQIVRHAVEYTAMGAGFGSLVPIPGAVGLGAVIGLATDIAITTTELEDRFDKKAKEAEDALGKIGEVAQDLSTAEVVEFSRGADGRIDMDMSGNSCREVDDFAFA